MGCDIHMYGEAKNADGSYRRVEVGDALGDRTYGRFGFLAGVRNYSGVTPIAEPRGVPADVSPEVGEELGYGDLHSVSWLTLAELRAFNYQAMTEDRRYTKQTGPNSYDGGATCEPGQGESMTYREFLGEQFFAELARIEAAGVDRIVFGFDS